MYKRGAFDPCYLLRVYRSDICFGLGLLDTPEVKSIGPEEDQILMLYTGHNSRAYSTRLKALGWAPKEKGIIETVDDDIDFSAKMFTRQTN